MDSRVLISKPTFEHREDAFGIGHPRPRLSWRFLTPENAEPARDWTQAAYEIEVRHEERSSENSQRYLVASAHSVLVPWPGSSLCSGDAVSVRVRAYAAAEHEQSTPSTATPTEWSPWAQAECTFLSRSDWQAVPIATPCKYEAEQGDPLRPVRFRRSFVLPSDRRVVRARLYVTAHGVYEIYLNESRVGDHVLAPGWTSYHHRLGFQTFDVTSVLLQSNDANNRIAAEVGEGWYAGRMGIRGGRPFNYGTEVSLLAQLEMTLDNGERVVIATGEDWECSSSSIETSEIYNGEVCDLRCEQWDWKKSASDHIVEHDSGWIAVKTLPFPTARIFSTDHPPIRVTEEIWPTAIITSPSGKLILDFGQNLVGVPCIKHVPPSTKITLRHAEVLEDGELGVRPLRGAKCTDVIRTGERGVYNWTPKFTFHGFRFIQVDGWDHSPLCPGDIIAKVLHTDMQRRGWFKCSDPLVNRLHENIVWSMRGNFLSVPTDCPQRDERLGWTGDIQVFGPTANFLYNTVAILSNWLEDLDAEQMVNPSGIPGLVVPDVMGDFWTPTPQAVWHDAVILTPWNLYEASEDKEILRRQYPGMVRWLREAIRRGDDGLWDPDIWQLGDWVDPAAPPGEPGSGRTDGVLVADAYLVHVTFIMANICAVLDLAQEHEQYASEAALLRETFQHKYITPLGNLANYTQAAIALAVQFNLYSSLAQLETARKSLARLVKAAKFHVSTGFAGTPMILPALVTTAQTSLAYRMLMEKHCPSWLYPVTMGATTIWERWDALLPDGSLNPGQMLSFNHYAFGAVGNWLHSTVGGISSCDGWRTILVRPIPGGGLAFANVAFEGPYGRVECSWSVESGTFHLKLLVPANTIADITLPSRTAFPVNSVPQIVGSGSHIFSVPYEGETWPPAPAPASYSGIRGKICDCP
ncbi:bacterial alpha-L-rhamnosidase-domain-containing protein [Aspergillus pseudoustus]|uniref:alpha-L-rhamnosidase n=1 Tax=Aspergillus pseudoustus TaxID=1810923 RepID=A0ABR4IL99_9EURO